MKKLLLILTAVAAIVLIAAGVANAYPPNGQNVTATPTNPVPGGQVTVTTTCTVGETVTVTLGSSSATATCVAGASGGTATVTVNAPTSAGTYTGSVTGSVSGDIGSFTVTVQVQTSPTTTAPTGGLPATGSNGASTMTMVAGGLLVVGLGLFGVATARRRQDSVAA